MIMNESRAGIILYNKIGKILMVKGKLTGKWSFPKGKIENNESVAQAAYREFYEETGRPIGKYIRQQSLYTFKNYTYIIAKIESLDIPKTGVVDKNEIECVKWFNINELQTIDTNMTVKTYIKTLIPNRPRFLSD